MDTTKLQNLQMAMRMAMTRTDASRQTAETAQAQYTKHRQEQEDATKAFAWALAESYSMKQGAVVQFRQPPDFDEEPMQGIVDDVVYYPATGTLRIKLEGSRGYHLVEHLRAVEEPEKAQ
jgi:hypothetical protein